MPLAFTDQSLARLVTAASKVSQRSRAKWLRAVARQLEPTPNILKCRNARERAKNGTAYYRLELDQVAIEEMLVRERLLSPGQEYSRREVEAALTTFLMALADLGVGPHS
jgi:hypothetical protein